jgi:hypothetical protein
VHHPAISLLDNTIVRNAISPGRKGFSVKKPVFMEKRRQFLFNNGNQLITTCVEIAGDHRGYITA